MAALDRRDTLLAFNKRDLQSTSKSNRNSEEHESGSRAVASNARDNLGASPALLQSLLPQKLTQNLRQEGPSRTSGLLSPRTHDPWTKFKPLLHVRQGCAAVLACSIPPDQQDYAVRIVASSHKNQHQRGIQQLSYGVGGIDRVHDIFDWSGKLFIVTDYVKPNLSQIITSRSHLTEAHIAFIAHAVSPTPDIPTSC